MPKSPELGSGGENLGKEALEGRGGEFDEISNLASNALKEMVQKEEAKEAAAQTATAKELAEKQTTETQEAQKLRESQDKLINQLSGERQGNLVKGGMENYYFLVRDQAGLKKMGSTLRDTDRQRQSEYIQLTSPWELDHWFTGPQDFFEAYDKSVAWFDERIQEQIAHYGDMDEEQLNELIRQRHQEMAKESYPYLIDNDKWGKEGERYQARDLPPDLFAKVLKELHPCRINRLYNFRKKKEDDLVILRSFSETALKSGDVENALEGFNRLNDLNNAEFTVALKQTIEKLRQSGDSKDQLRLRSILTRIREIRG